MAVVSTSINYWYSVLVTGADGTLTSYTFAPTETVTVAAEASSTQSTDRASTSGSSSSSLGSVFSSLGHASSSSSPTSTSSTAAEVSSSSSSSTRVARGALVGAAVGCAIGGLLIGIAVALLFFRRRSKQQNGHYPSQLVESAVLPNHDQKGNSASAISPSSSDSQLNTFLLDATPENEIKTELLALGQLLDQHVESHYHHQPTQKTVAELSQYLVELGFGQSTGLMPEAIATLCIKVETRQVGLRHVISETIFRSIDIYSRSQHSMLPPPIAAFLQSMTSIEQQGGNPQVMALALSKWRRLSAMLLHPSRTERSPLPISKDVVASQAPVLAESLNKFLSCFVEANEHSQREQTNHLVAVIVECTRLGYVLLSHPSEWQFVFEDTSIQRSIVVSAGLNKLGPQDGSRYSTPVRIVDPLTMPI